MTTKNNKIGRLAAYALTLILIVGVAAGAGIWLMNVNVPIDYNQPYVISMSQDEEAGYDWNELPFRETTELSLANFSSTGSGLFYHQYVRIVNPANGVATVNVQFNVTEPSGFSDDMGFIFFDGIVEPGDEGEEEVDTWGTYGNNVTVNAGETVFFTIMYILGPDVPVSNDHIVTWTFRDITNE